MTHLLVVAVLVAALAGCGPATRNCPDHTLDPGAACAAKETTR